jgi:hypothetical protein
MRPQELRVIFILCLVVGFSDQQDIDEVELRKFCQISTGEPLHISLVSIPTKGHINPLIGIAQQFHKLGCKVTIPIVEVILESIHEHRILTLI